MSLLFLYNDTATTAIYTLSLHDALPIWSRPAFLLMIGVRPNSPIQTTRVFASMPRSFRSASNVENAGSSVRSEEHTSELQSRRDLVCRLLLEKKKITT